MAARDNKSIRGSDLQAILTAVAEKIKACSQSADASAVNEVIAAALVDLSGRLDGLDEATKEMVTRDYIQSECRLKQSAKASPSASGTAISFIDTVSQDENGDVTATRKTVRNASTGQTGVVQLNNSVTSSSTSQAATANAVKTAYDEASAAYDKPSGGIPKSDLASSVQASLGLADTALQNHQDISGKLDADGDGQNVTVDSITLSSADKPTLYAGETLSVLFGKIKRWFAQLGSLAFKNKVGTGDVNSGTYGIDISGNAATATTATTADSATNDSAGNNISTYYAKRAFIKTLNEYTNSNMGSSNARKQLTAVHTASQVFTFTDMMIFCALINFHGLVFDNGVDTIAVTLELRNGFQTSEHSKGKLMASCVAYVQKGSSSMFVRIPFSWIGGSFDVTLYLVSTEISSGSATTNAQYYSIVGNTY